MSKVLLKYIPESALSLVNSWYREYDFHLRISKSRKSKFGDFRPAYQGKPNRISVNGDLNQYHFLITLTHEIAHVACWTKYKSTVNPHGAEWKNIYSQMLKQLMSAVEFPEDVNHSLIKHLNRPKASSCSDPDLFKVLKRYNASSNTVFLEELEQGEHFTLHETRIFSKGKKRRTRFECVELKSQKLYLVSGHAEVERLSRNS